MLRDHPCVPGSWDLPAGSPCEGVGRKNRSQLECEQTPESIRSLPLSQKMASRSKKDLRSTLAHVPQSLVKHTSSRVGAFGSSLMLSHCWSPASFCLFFCPSSPHGLPSIPHPLLCFPLVCFPLSSGSFGKDNYCP